MDHLETKKTLNKQQTRFIESLHMQFWSMRSRVCPITKTRLFKYIEKFTSKNWKFSDKKKTDFFHISAQNIYCGYSFEPPRRGGRTSTHYLCFWAEIRKIMYTPVNPRFTV